VPPVASKPVARGCQIDNKISEVISLAQRGAPLLRVHGIIQ